MSKATKDYEQFHRHYEPFVGAFVARRVPAGAVDDVVAEVFAIAWRRRTVVPVDALPWLYRTARNVVGNQYRTERRLATLRDKIMSVPIEASSDPAAAVIQRERTLAAFTDLSEADRELLLLVAWEGLSVQDVAAVLDISPGTASVRLHRARERLDRAIDQPANEGEQR